MYDVDQLQAALGPRPLRYFAEVGSTNDVALGWLRQGAPPGAVVVADVQLQGRGRFGRHWHALAGTALIVSALLKPPRESVGRLTLVGAVAIAETIEALGLAVDIKWPNDARLNQRKVCGILPEAAWDGETLVGAALGMGLNVRVDFSGTELADSAISLEPALGRPLDRATLLARLLERVDYWSVRAGSDLLFEAWKRRLSTIGQTVTVSEGAVHGVAEGVDDQGALLVRTDQGDVRRVIAGDIRLGE